MQLASGGKDVNQWGALHLPFWVHPPCFALSCLWDQVRRLLLIVSGPRGEVVGRAAGLEGLSWASVLWLLPAVLVFGRGPTPSMSQLWLQLW